MQGTDCPDSNGQHNCSLLHQQGGWYEIRFSLCPTLETPVLVSSQKDSSGGETHPRSLECHSGQAVQTQSSDTDRVVPVSAGFPTIVFKMGQTSDLFATRFNHRLPKFVSAVPDPAAWGVDFLLYLFKGRHLQPSTIEGYRTAIADMIINERIQFGKDENFTRLLDNFHRDEPKGRRGVPAWNLSLVLHQLAKAPFEPMRKASPKHLTFKTVFLWALGSGKRRSEIHAWLYRNIRHQENWSQVSVYPSPSFLSKNQLARDSPAAVALMVIPALAPYLDKSLKEDRSLCPVRALRYYLDRTTDLRAGKDLVFVFPEEFSEGHCSGYCLFLGSNKLCCCTISFRTRKPKLFIKFGLMMSGPLQPPKPFKAGFLWIRSYRLAIGKLTTLLHSSI